jgi:hypothetical protein
MNEQKFQNIYHLTYPKISRYVVSKCRNIEDLKPSSNKWKTSFKDLPPVPTELEEYI